ncbi:hypothetical protein, partial [Lactobacillus crispatus]|uniref:hypothetical protein n=1 Tax=Lactobacillus crispatus TaxID=47770 RepID=UPI0037099268
MSQIDFLIFYLIKVVFKVILNVTNSFVDSFEIAYVLAHCLVAIKSINRLFIAKLSFMLSFAIVF